MLLGKSIREIYLQCKEMYTVSTTGLSHPSFWHLQMCYGQNILEKKVVKGNLLPEAWLES